MKLPVAGDILDLGTSVVSDEVMVVAVDLGEWIWTCVRKDGSIVLLSADENGNYAVLNVEVDWEED